ncbi:unnamed protein product [Cunninghamella echinulata]
MIENSDTNNNNIQKRSNPYLPDTSSNKRHETYLLNTSTSHYQNTLNKTNNTLSDNTKNSTTQSKLPQDKFIYGNYANYYKSRRNTTDHHDIRLSLLEKSMFKNKKVLDIGCNSGNVTMVIGKYCKPQHILGVDIDEQLINKANSLLKTVYSLQKKDADDDNNEENNKILTDINFRTHYFPKSMTSMFGYLPTATPPTFKSTQFPFNISFKTALVLQNGYSYIMGIKASSYFFRKYMIR